jgi:hypothetical protein
MSNSADEAKHHGDHRPHHEEPRGDQCPAAPGPPPHRPDPPWEDRPGLLVLALTDIISLLTHEIRESREQRKTEYDWFRSHVALATKSDLEKMERKIMAKLEDLVAAATALSTSSDGLSIKVDDLVSKVDKVLATIGSTDLPADAEAAVAALKTSKDKVVAQGDKVDAEVLKLDAVLPTPAPAGPPA